MSCIYHDTVVGCYNGTQAVVLHYFYGKDNAGLTILERTVIADAVGVPIPAANGTNTTVGACSLPLRKYRVVQALVAGTNLITHNLNLQAPIASMVELRDDATGVTILARVSAEAPNTLTITVATAVSAARITIF